MLIAGLGIYFVFLVSMEVAVWTLWLPRGRDTLVVYSTSPLWHEYFESRVLPRVSTRAVVLNWSERRTWMHRLSLSALVFRCFAGSREFNPIAFHFRPLRMHSTYRFRIWRKTGDSSELDQLMTRFFAELES